jgi:hypothetical protein
MNKSNLKKIIIPCLSGIFSIIFISGILYSGDAKKSNSISFKIMLNEKNCQMAIWITDANGKFIDTVYVTKKTAKDGLGNQPGGLDDKSGGPRLSTVPVWAFARGIDYGGGNFYPPADRPLPDAVTSATPKSGEFSRTWIPAKPLKPGKYFFYIEIDKSFQKNSSHNYSWYRGQPSVVWKGSFTAGRISSSGKAKIIGHGDPAGANGKIYPDVSTLTTALKYIENAEAVYQP